MAAESTYFHNRSCTFTNSICWNKTHSELGNSVAHKLLWQFFVSNEIILSDNFISSQ